METDARGQLGGLETTDAARQQLASESSSFRCSTCAKTNGEIIQECEERASEASSSSAAKEAVEVPKELSMGWRDEMEAKKKEQTNGEQTDQAENAQLAEGFVQTAPTDNAPPPPPAPGAVPLPPSAQLPTPTRTIPIPAAPAPPAPGPVPVAPPAVQIRQARRGSDDGVPLWLDRMIVVLVVLLVAIVLKIIFAI